jgi:hypothetical protein
VLSRRQPQPSGQFTSSPELSTVTNGGQYRGCSHRPDAGNGHEPPSPVLPIGNCFDLPCDRGDALIDMADVPEYLGQHLAHRRTQIVAVIREDPRKVDTEGANTLPHGDPILQTEGSCLVDQPSADGDQLISHSM